MALVPGAAYFRPHGQYLVVVGKSIVVEYKVGIVSRDGLKVRKVGSNGTTSLSWDEVKTVLGDADAAVLTALLAKAGRAVKVNVEDEAATLATAQEFPDSSG